MRERRPSRPPLSPLAALALLVFPGRWLTNVALRFFQPYLPFLAAGLGLSPGLLPPFLSLLSWTGLATPWMGRFADRRGRRPALIAGLALLALGAGAFLLPRPLLTVPLGFLLLGLGRNLYLPASQAYAAEAVPPERRGLSLSLTELSWSTAGLLGVTTVGALLERRGVAAPFWILLLLGAGGTALLAALLPEPGGFRGPRPRLPEGEARGRFSFRTLLADPEVRRPLLLATLALGSGELFFISYGLWGKEAFGLGPAGIALFPLAGGFAEVVGELAIAATADRLGGRRATFLGFGLAALAYPLLPWLGPRGLPWALASFAAAVAAFEYAVIATLVWHAGLREEARGTVLGLYSAALSLGRAWGDLLAPLLWGLGGAGLGLLGASVGTALALAAGWGPRGTAEDDPRA